MKMSVLLLKYIKLKISLLFLKKSSCDVDTLNAIKITTTKTNYSLQYIVISGNNCIFN